MSAGGSGLATNQAYQDGDTADPQQFQAPTERKPRMKQAVCCLSNSKGDPGPHGSVTLTRQEELGLSAHWAAKKAERDRVQEHIGTKCFAV